MSFKLRGSHLIAAAICAAIGGWMYTGELIIGGQAGTTGAAKPIAEREAERTATAFKVLVRELKPTERNDRLLIRGRTEAEAKITVRAETGGTLEKRAVDKGDLVKPGDLLCVIDQGIRKSNLRQAEAKLAQAKADYDGKNELAKKGFSTKITLRAAKTALDAASAALDTAKQDIERTEVRASVYGEVTSPLAETGDHLSPGNICVTLIDSDPMLFIGQVSERDIYRISRGMAAGVQLVTGEQVLGKIGYIAPNADPKTRTFRVEISMANPQHKLRDGLTAKSVIELQSTPAYLINPSWLTLADNGDVGVRGVDKENKVYFIPLKILSQTREGMWVSGIEPRTHVITRGHEYVAAGELVEPSMTKTDDAVAPKETTSKKTETSKSSHTASIDK